MIWNTIDIIILVVSVKLIETSGLNGKDLVTISSLEIELDLIRMFQVLVTEQLLFVKMCLLHR